MHAFKELAGRGLKPVLESERLDKVRYLKPLRTFARDWAVAFGFWDDGALAKDNDLRPVNLAQSAGVTRARAGQASLTLYIDKRDALTNKARMFLQERQLGFSEIDVSNDAASVKWLAETHNGARPPQLFVDGQRLGGLADLEALDATGELLARLAPSTAGA